MANKCNLSGCFNILNINGLKWYVDQYAIPASLHPVLPEKDTPIYPFIPGKIGVYTRMFDYCNYRLPLTKFLVEVLLLHEVHLTQVNPIGLAKVRNKNSCCYSWITFSLKDWKDRFFLIDDRCVPPEMSWRLKREAGRAQKYPEHILVMGQISTIWAEPEWYPSLRWNREVMGLKDALRLKSFDYTEVDVQATKIPQGDPPYLSVVQENLYQIREPTAPVNQGGSAGQGGSGSALSMWTTNEAPAHTAAWLAVIKEREQFHMKQRGPVPRLFYMVRNTFLLKMRK
ncbi:hypothetical protein Hanom_Chr09g00812671 [Helianthus anomalus]